ncbi:MAG TPA: nucleotidyltransferase domain-containing protein [Methanosarcinaceae archaeon]|nr:nucleotidyltransferase domain-containing protein [Methanosarcinaceae archaeon]HJH31122.1 nucleotidyltransferase domain-containing protein [Methanosarcinaceae archaeon]
MIRFEQELIEFFETKDSVTLAYLFGSTVRGDANQLSDVDIAVKFDESLSKKDVFGAELSLISELTGILKTDKVDLVVMNDAPLLLNYNIIKNGKILKSDESIRIQFETMTLSTYLDEKHYIEQHTNNILNRVAQSGFA